MQVTIGCDPELFVTKGRDAVSAHGMIPGTKRRPHKVDKGAVQVDGMALEFNIEPAENEETFANNIAVVLSQLRSMISEEYNLSVLPSITFKKEVYLKQPPEARMLGCDPDFNAYTDKVNPPLRDLGYKRYAGGHVHVGWKKNGDPFSEAHFNAAIRLVKQLDIFLGLPSVIMDKDQKRRNIYGQAGIFRPKPYGVEYRTLSNFWIQDLSAIRWVFNSTWMAFNTLVTKKKELYTKYDVREIINTGNQYEARKLMEHIAFNEKTNIIRNIPRLG